MNKIIENYIEKINYNAEDLRDSYDAVSAIIYDQTKTKILMQDHVKLNFWTIPVGKAKDNQNIIEALKEEISEECGIKLLKFKEVFVFEKTYLRQGKNVRVKNHCFEIEKYSGIPKNLEPHKHRSQIFIEINKISKIGKISDATKNALKYLKNKS